MSKIEKLLDKLCPNGVKYESLVNLCGTITTGKLNANAMDENGVYPFFTCDSNPFKINTYAFDEEAILISGNGSQVGHINYYKGKFNAYQRTYVLYDFKEINVKFLLHFLNGYLKEYILKNCKKGSVPYITLPMLQNFSVPVPPLEIQCEIVHILDDFTLLSAELSVELKARQKQYEYYKEKMLTFSKDDTNVKWVNLGEYCKRLKGTAITAGKMKEIANENGNLKIFAGGKTMINTDENTIPQEDIIRVPNIIVQSRGIIDFIYYDKPCSYKREMWSYTANNMVTLKFIYYYLKSNVEFFRQRGSQMGSMPQISLDVTEKYKIPIPRYEEQKRIVNILDKLDFICNDMFAGLPAEIEARQKQYEYYRDKLLTFKELKNEG